MRPIPLIRAAGLRPFTAFLERIGAPVESLWARARLPLRGLRDLDAAIPLLLGVRFAEDAARSEGIEQLGLLAARDCTVACFGARGRRIRRALTLFDAIRGVVGDQPTWNSGARFWIAAEGSQVHLAQRSVWRTIPSRQVDVVTLSAMIEVVGAAADPGWLPESIDLQSAGPYAFPDDHLLAGVEVRTGRGRNAFSFPRSFLSRRLRWPSPLGAPERPDHAGSSPDTSALPEDFLGSAREVIGALLEARQLHVASAAEAAGSSLRSFQRRLAENGVSFSRLVDETRFDVARRLLGDPDVKIIDVALASGYSDPAHFTRAFRRWTAYTPIEYRRLSTHEGRTQRSA